MIAIAIGLAIAMFFLGLNSAVINPIGQIAIKERNLIIIATVLMLIVVIPVFFMAFYFPWKYRADNTKAHSEYAPDWDYNFTYEAIWWGFPCVIVFALSVLAWQSTHELDPYKPINTNKQPITIQVVALQWKWLFIYPEQNIATVNFVQFPEKTPVKFEITSDAPMNSFWIPMLAGQIYAMPGMRTELNVIADETGNFRGSSANLSGEGFSGMYFTAKSTSQEDFDHWVQSIKQSPKNLNQEEYKKLASPSEYHPIEYFTMNEKALFDQIVMKYMMSKGTQTKGIEKKNETPSSINKDLR